MELKDIKERLENATIAVATCDSKNIPHNIAIMYAKVVEDQIVITNNFMKKTVENIKINPNVSLVFWGDEEGWRIDGKAVYFSSGKWLDFVKSMKENEGMPAQGAIVVNIKSINKLCG